MEQALLINITDPATELSKIIHYRAPPSDIDSTRYNWEYIMSTISDIPLIKKPATVKLLSELRRKTVSKKTQAGDKVFTTYTYEGPVASAANVPQIVASTVTSTANNPQVIASKESIKSTTTIPDVQITGASTRLIPPVPPEGLTDEYVNAFFKSLEQMKSNTAQTKSNTDQTKSNIDQTTASSSGLMPSTPAGPATASSNSSDLVSSTRTGLDQATAILEPMPFSTQPTTSSANPTMSFGANLCDIKRRRLGTDNRRPGTDNRTDSNSWVLIAKQIIMEEKIRELATTINTMQHMVDNIKDNLEQLSFNSPTRWASR